jgi:hypothetical protein
MEYFILNKITARALGYEIYFKMIMAVLSHDVSADQLDIAISVVKEITLRIYIRKMKSII